MPKEWKEMTSEEKIEELRREILNTKEYVRDFRSEYDLQAKDYALVREALVTLDRSTGKLRPKGQ
jgi:hypothetical protein